MYIWWIVRRLIQVLVAYNNIQWLAGSMFCVASLKSSSKTWDIGIKSQFNKIQDNCKMIRSKKVHRSGSCRAYTIVCGIRSCVASGPGCWACTYQEHICCSRDGSHTRGRRRSGTWSRCPYLAQLGHLGQLGVELELPDWMKAGGRRHGRCWRGRRGWQSRLMHWGG